MIPESVTAWTALVNDRYVGGAVEFLGSSPYGVRLDALVEMTVNEIIYSGTFRHLSAEDQRSEAAELWTTDTRAVTAEVAQMPHVAEVTLSVHDGGRANALALWFSSELAPGVSLDWAGGSAHPLGHDDGSVAGPGRGHAGNGSSRSGQHETGSTCRNLDELGDRAARFRVGGDQRLTGSWREGALADRSERTVLVPDAVEAAT